MRIQKIKISNFRKLQECSVNFSKDKTLFVGSNNSGKTSAMHALMLFLGNESKKFQITDFPIDYWKILNDFGESWLSDDIALHKGINISEWQKYCPTMEITLSDFIGSDLSKVKHLIPNLSWSPTSNLSVKLIYQPKDLEKLRELFIQTIKQIQLLINSFEPKEQQISKLPLPRNMEDFLRNYLHNHFSIQAFIFDKTGESGQLKPIDQQPFSGIFKLSVIPAQRGFTDSIESNKSVNNLSTQLGSYYDKHLNPKILPDENDIKALREISQLQDIFSKQLRTSFKEAIKALTNLGYPGGIDDPFISLESYIDTSEILKQNTKVTFGLQEGIPPLPEELNGLGYRNLIYIFFKLLSFRDEWQQKGKLSKTYNEKPIEPVHLVLIEEPEAHLHSQVQQVFVKKAYEILTDGIENKDLYTTQLVISTHSSYITHELGFDYLHYFQKTLDKNTTDVPRSKAIDISNVFSNQTDDKTKKFVSRYLKTVHCDLFFANAVILVEGSAERMLLPYFIQKHFSRLNSSYISILEINGAHAYRFKPLTDALGIPTLVITDLDSVDPSNNNKKTRPIRGEGYISNCNNLKRWLGVTDNSLENVLSLKIEDRKKDNALIVYQQEVEISWDKGKKIQVIPYTFEDSIMFTNFDLFRHSDMGKKTGMLKKMYEATQENSLNKCCQKTFESLNGEKAKMALDILYEFSEENLTVPNYIKEGLDWLIKELDSKEAISTGDKNE